MRLLLFVCVFIALIALSCCARVDVAEFEHNQNQTEDTAKKIANYLTALQNVEESAVQIQGQTAVVGINLAYEHNDKELIALKKKIIAEIKQQNNEINHVAVTTALDLFEKINEINGKDTLEEKNIEKQLEKNNKNEIFTNIAPTP